VKAHPQLSYLAQAYFHQDYGAEASTPLDVVREFRDNERPQVTDALVAEIRAILDSGMTEAQVGEIWLNSYRAYYESAADGISYRAWLAVMVDILCQA
jgi:contact-dependent growth inhibition (CDI) system CdiI-like immunity protein